MVFSLDASDEFLRQRVMNLPEKTVAGTHYNEEGVCVFAICHCPLSIYVDVSCPNGTLCKLQQVNLLCTNVGVSIIMSVST